MESNWREKIKEFGVTMAICSELSLVVPILIGIVPAIPDLWAAILLILFFIGAPIGWLLAAIGLEKEKTTIQVQIIIWGLVVCDIFLVAVLSIALVAQSLTVAGFGFTMLAMILVSIASTAGHVWQFVGEDILKEQANLQKYGRWAR